MKEVYIPPTAVVDKTAKIGEGTKIWHFVHVRENAEIGRNCVLGHSVYVDKEVTIGNGAKLENRATIYHGVKIEDKVLWDPMSLSKRSVSQKLQYGLENRGDACERFAVGYHLTY